MRLIGLALAPLLMIAAMSAASGGIIQLPQSCRPRPGSMGLVLMLVIGVLSGLLPALRAMRLNIVDALAGPLRRPDMKTILVNLLKLAGSLLAAVAGRGVDRPAVVRRARARRAGRHGWLLTTRSGALHAAATGIGIASLPQRWGASAVIVVGIAGVVGVLVAMLAMGEGFKATLNRTPAATTARSSCAAVRRRKPTR